MSFDPFKFIFTPPKTVEPPTDSRITTSLTPAVGQEFLPTTQSGLIIAKLDELIATSTYLQQLILERSLGLGIEIDFDIDVEMQRALAQLYGSDGPNILTISMFNKLLDADIGVMQLDMAAGNDSSIEANPFQAASLMTVTRTLEKHLISNGTFNSNVPVMLRTLKGDTVIFNEWKKNLNTYPAVTNAGTVSIDNFRPGSIHTRDVDLSMNLYLYMDDYTNRYASAYSGIYKLLAEVSHVENDIQNVVNAYFFQPLENLVRMVGMFNALKGLIHKPRLQDIADDLLNFTFVRLMGESTNMLFNLDQLINIAVSPLKGALGSLGRIVSVISGLGKTVGYLGHGGLKGMLSNNACGEHTANSTNHDPKNELEIPGLGTVSTGLRTLGEHLDWSSRESERHMATVNKQFQRIAERRLEGHADRIDLMCSLHALDSLIGLGQGFIQEQQKGTISATSTPQQRQEALTRILSNLKTGSDSTFVIQGEDDILVNPPHVIDPPTPVKKVLSRGGIKRFVDSERIPLNKRDPNVR